jgi:capsid protein
MLNLFKTKPEVKQKMDFHSMTRLLTMEAELPPVKQKTVVNKFYSGGGEYRVLNSNFNGEKNIGEIGPIRKYDMNYDQLRLRSWQAYIESEIAQTVINKYVSWIIGTGLRLQACPNTLVLESEGISLKDQMFTDLVEARFSAYCKAKEAHYSKQMNVDEIAETVELNAILGGDVLVIKRYDESMGIPTIQMIDGSHVKNPPVLDASYKAAIEAGNRIINGIELSPTGEHVAYYICSRLYQFERVKAKSETGLVMAYLHYGLKYRLDNYRGIPLITVVMEKLKKMERYDEATIGSAEERQKVAMAIEHGRNSDGEDPNLKRLAYSFRDGGDDDDDLASTDDGEALARTIALSTNKQVWNLPIDAKLTVLDSKNELYFKDFFTVNIDLVCAALGIPPNVAMSKYDSNFSASRAAMKDWEHSLVVNREKFSRQFYFNLYNLWLEIEVLRNKIQAPGYLRAREQNNVILVSAYRNTRFIGDNVPHIDPEKEANAERVKLGDAAKDLPLTSLDQATENLGGGNSETNMKRLAAELKSAKQLGIVTVVPPPSNV